MQRMFLTVSNFPVRRTGSKKALYFIHNDTPKLSPPKYFDYSKNNIYSATYFFSRNTWKIPTTEIWNVKKNK